MVWIDAGDRWKRVHVHVQKVVTPELHAKFLQACDSIDVQGCSLPTFYKYKPDQVRMKRLPSKADLLDLCPHCSKHKKLKLKKHLSGITPAEEKNLEHLQEHIDTSISQMRFYKAEKRRVLSNGTFKTTRFAIHDFSKYHNNGVMYNDLMISVLLWDEENKTYKWIYLDFVQKAEMGGEQDYYFVRGIWRWMLGLDQNLNYTYFSSSESLDPRTLFQVDNVVIFSDGAGQHFKQKKTICFWAEIQRDLGIQIEIHFFGSYHGHNVCDSHSSHVKRIILKKIRELGQDEFITEDQLVKALGSLKNTHIFFLSSGAIDRSMGPPVLEPLLSSQLEGIRSCHHFRLNNKGEEQFLDCYRLSQDESPTMSILLPTEEQIANGTYERPSRGNQQREEFDSFCSEEDDGSYFGAPDMDDDAEYLPPAIHPLGSEVVLNNEVPEEEEDLLGLDQDTEELFAAAIVSNNSDRPRRTTQNSNSNSDYVFYN